MYFMDDEVSNMFNKTCGHDMSVFDLAEEKITPFYEGDDATTSDYFAPVWFMPDFVAIRKT